MSRFVHWSFAAAAAIALAVPCTSHAQFGGLKKKMKDKITGDPQPAAAAADASPGDADVKARRDAWDHPVAISSATLEGLAKGLQVEQDARAKFASAGGSSPIARWNAYLAEQRKCDSDKQAMDSTSARLQRNIMEGATKGHDVQKYVDSLQALVPVEQKRQQRCGTIARPTFTDADFKAVHAQEEHEDSLGAAAAGVSPLAYARLKERVIAYVLMPSSGQPNGYQPAELQAIEARRAELKKMLGRDYNSSGERNPVGS